MLPFVNLSADKNNEYLERRPDGGIAQRASPGARFAHAGTKHPSLSRGRPKTAFPQVGEELHVNAELEGSVRKAGEKLRITAQLIDVADGCHRWSQTSDRDMKDILAIQSDVAQRVVECWKRSWASKRRARWRKLRPKIRKPPALAAGPLPLRQGHESQFDQRHAVFEQALQVDPAYALAYCGDADGCGWIGGK